MKTQNKPTELSNDEQKNINGGGIFDDSRLTSITQGYISQSSTDDDGDTESNNLGFGLGTQNIFEED